MRERKQARLPWVIRSERLCWLYFAALILIAVIVVSCSQDAKSAASTDTAASTPSATLPPPVETVAEAPVASPTSPAPAATAAQEAQAPFQPPGLAYLKEAFDARLASFDGIASYYVRDLKGGQVAMHNGDVAISGTSIVKIPILLETYRVLEEAPTLAEMRLITETATLSGNYTANLLLERIAGQSDPYAGAQKVTEAVRRLGFYNTFIAVPYDLTPDPRYFSTYSTPANQNPDITTNPDSSMQTTAYDIGELLAMIYDCSAGHGYLLDVYAGSLTQAECRQILDVMEHNDIDAFIEEGVPAGVPVAHKHGWVGETHGDAAIVEHAEFPYVFVIALHRPEWLTWAESTEIIAGLSRLAYAHFADTGAYPAQTLQRAPEPLPTLAPTPALPIATIGGTGGAGLVLRQAPGGAELMVLPEGSLVFLVDEAAVAQDGRVWRQVRLPGDIQGWVVDEFLNAQ